ncbi:VOC family protein [Subtercola lobariae]|uniref:Glyoxalase n=1 Tax=Subtercola lobariae TaxID=1588641 RepID=A0A917B4F1_9MICO|nr:VOC family protein [Subtercola lobariae]GGF23063.1 glyoxalase [Subtercola lobariae]
MATTLFGISYDAADAARTASFWAELLGRTVNPGATPESASIAPSDDPAAGPTLMFHQVLETKTVKNRVHLDLITTEFDDELARILSLGATVIAQFDSWTTLADLEGNEFDLVRG